ncbi:hypothetical protein [Chryseobacterium binzhouense]|uniref:hypothetical protein n=1 Tax=Chryseobacterium binzhouense TaxID=2593646 RepID=UPI0011817076|nr:hypothetical protein [Chryseobacterium binzhouense]MXS70012.1 hypothetical protein [Flavobacteriaceae bacterium W22]
MKRIIIILVPVLFNFSFAQSDKEILDVKGEREKIYTQFQENKSELYKKYILKHPVIFEKQSKTEKKVHDSLARLDYGKYKKELQLCKIKKIEELKKLLNTLNNQHPLIGKKMAYLKDYPNEVERINKLRDSEDFSGIEFLGIPNDQRGSYENLSAGRNEINQNFLSYFQSLKLKEFNEIPLSAKIYFILDTDGYLKKNKTNIWR